MGSAEIPITAAMVAAFIAVHLLIKRLRFIDVTPRSKWLSFSGGVAVSYVFLHVLPDLGAHSDELSEAMQVGPVAAESIVYAMALAGLAAFYGLERRVKISRARTEQETGDDKMGADALGLHAFSYAVFNLLIGYLLVHREETGAWALGLYFGAMMLHFITADYGMRSDHKTAYDRWVRWVIASAVLAGWLIGLAVDVGTTVIAGLFAFIAGGIVLNVLKEELPAERKSYFLPFLGGVLLYAVMVIAERVWA